MDSKADILQPEYFITSAARKVDTKRANLLLKVAQKRATLQNRFKTGLSLKPVLGRFKSDFKLELIPYLF